jgi:hypothetical protein
MAPSFLSIKITLCWDMTSYSGGGYTIAHAFHQYSLHNLPIKINIQVGYLLVRLINWHFKRFCKGLKLITN